MVSWAVKRPSKPFLLTPVHNTLKIRLNAGAKLELLARDYTLLQIIYLSRYKTKIQTLSPVGISADMSPEEMSKRLGAMAAKLGGAKPVGKQQ